MAKYSLEETKIGEIVNTPELAEIAKGCNPAF